MPLLFDISNFSEYFDAESNSNYSSDVSRYFYANLSFDVDDKKSFHFGVEIPIVGDTIAQAYGDNHV